MRDQRDDGPVGRGRRLFGRPVDGKIAGLTWPQTCVLVAACKTAFDLSDRRITVRRLAEQIESFVPDRATINECLDVLSDRGYVTLDDAPENFDAVVYVTPDGLERCADRFIVDLRRIRREIWTLVAQRGAECDVIELADVSGFPDLLVEHLLDEAQQRSLIRLSRREHYIAVTWVSPQLRRLTRVA